ncbi:hypothetical protein ACQGFJ_01400 [Rhodococcus sp. 3.70]
MNHFAPSRPGNEPDARDSGRWQELLDSLDVAELTDTFVKRVASIAGYDSSPLPTSEIERTGRMAFSAMLQGLRAGGLPDFVPVANDVGISRARAGIPITSLMTAIRLDYNVLWEALTSASSPRDAELLVRHTWIVLRTVDEYAAQTQGAYMAERERMLREDRLRCKDASQTCSKIPDPQTQINWMPLQPNSESHNAPPFWSSELPVTTSRRYECSSPKPSAPDERCTPTTSATS